MQLFLFRECKTCKECKTSDEFYLFADGIPVHCKRCYNTLKSSRRKEASRRRKISTEKAWLLLAPYYHVDRTGYTLNGQKMADRDVRWFNRFGEQGRVQAVKVDRLIVDYNLPFRLEDFSEVSVQD